MSANSLGVPAITRVVSDEGGDGVQKGRAYLYGPERNQVQKGADGFVAGVALFSARHGQPASIQTEGFAEVESSAAVAVGAPVFVQADGRCGASGTARLGNATSATDGEGERLSVDLSTKNAPAAAAV